MGSEKRKVVVADDNEDLCEVLKAILEEAGYEVSVVYEGFSLVTYLKENQDVDAIILDLVMPAKDGISVFDTVQSVSPASKLIIYTGHADYDKSVFAREADAFVCKTDGAEKLIEELERVLG